MNNKELLAIASSNETANMILSFVADRQRNTVYTAFSGLRADLKKKFGKEMNRKEFDETFRKLEGIKAGKLECSKRGVCLGFYWSVPIRQIGTLIKNKDEVGKAVDAAVAAKTEKNVAEQNHKAVESKLRRNATVVILRRNGEAKTIQISEKRLSELDL